MDCTSGTTSHSNHGLFFNQKRFRGEGCGSMGLSLPRSWRSGQTIARESLSKPFAVIYLRGAAFEESISGTRLQEVNKNALMAKLPCPKQQGLEYSRSDAPSRVIDYSGDFDFVAQSLHPTPTDEATLDMDRSNAAPRQGIVSQFFAQPFFESFVIEDFMGYEVPAIPWIVQQRAKSHRIGALQGGKLHAKLICFHRDRSRMRHSPRHLAMLRTPRDIPCRFPSGAPRLQGHEGLANGRDEIR